MRNLCRKNKFCIEDKTRFYPNIEKQDFIQISDILNEPKQMLLDEEV